MTDLLSRTGLGTAEDIAASVPTSVSTSVSTIVPTGRSITVLPNGAFPDDGLPIDRLPEQARQSDLAASTPSECHASPDLASLPLLSIALLDRDTCLALWQKRFGQYPPPYTSAVLMRRVLAYEAQLEHLASSQNKTQPADKSVARSSKRGSRGLSKPVRASLEAALKPCYQRGIRGGAAQPGAKRAPSVLPARLKPGMHLVREWNGRTYQVEVLEKGFRMDGRDYPSLSAIANRITGTKWSGPRFFGLRGVS